MRLVSALDQARRGGRAGRPGRRAASAAAAAAGLILVAGCHVPGFSSSAGGGPTASGTVTVAAPPGVADAPLYIGIRDGLFSRAGLTIKIVHSGTVPEEVAALRNHTADIAFGDYASMFYAQEQKPHPNLLVVADGYDGGPNMMEVLTLPGSGISSPTDLENKTIGTAQAQGIPAISDHKFQPYSIDTLATWSVLSSDNVEVSKIAWAQFQGADSLINALRTKQVNAIVATEPTIYEAESQLGAIPVLDSCTGATANLPLSGYFTTGSFASQHASVVAAFRAALVKAQAQASMGAPLQTALTKSEGLQARTAAMVTLGTYPTTLSAANLQQVSYLLWTFGSLPKQVSVSSMVARANGS
jgi:NitT/TauT family transport system substrate-binding protein